MKTFFTKLFFAMQLLMCATVANAQSFLGDGIYYNVTSSSNKTLEVIYRGEDFGYLGEYSGKVIIPATVIYKGTTYNVTSIGDYAFYFCDGLTSITIPNSVTSIGDYAFGGCTGLTSVTIPNSVTTIGSSAFEYCSGLTSIEIPNSVTSIGYDAFRGCTGLTSIIVDDGNSIYDSRNGCNAIIETGSNTLIKGCKNTIIPNSVTNVGNGAFYGCSGLTSIEIPNSVTSIGDEAFSGCTELISVTVPASVLYVGKAPFPEVIKMTFLGNTPPRDYNDYIYKPKAKVIYVSDRDNYGFGIEYARLSSIFEVGGVKYVPLSTNECDVIDCSYDESASSVYVDSVIIYKNRKLAVRNINSYSFYKNDYINQVYVNNGGYVGDSAFYECSGINSDVIVKNDGNIMQRAFYKATLTGLSISNNGYIGLCAFQNCANLQNAVISNNGYIGNYAFQNNGLLHTADIDNNGNVGDYAFQNCSSLTNLSLGEHVGDIGNYTFESCSSLKELVIPDWIKKVGVYCFSNCTSLKKVDTGSGIKILSEGLFKGNTSLIDMNLGVAADSIRNKVFCDCRSLPCINIPKNIVYIGDSVFYNCEKMTLASFKDDDTDIFLGGNGNSGMFSSCPLDSVYIGRRLKYNTINSYARSPFVANKYLRSVFFNDFETKIYNSEFENCSNLQYVVIGNGTTEVGAFAFAQCVSLPSIRIPNSVFSMGGSTFKNCTSLKEAIIGNNTDAIKYSAFMNCSSLINIEIGEKVASIDKEAFSGCVSLPAIRIPRATTSLGDKVFAQCESLRNFYAEDGELVLSVGQNDSSNASGKIGDTCPLFNDCPLDSIYIGRDLSYTKTMEAGYSPFYFNPTLRAVVLGDKVTSVHENEFYQCKKLEYVSVGDGATSVGNWAFSGCVSLKYFSFGVGLESIGKEAFSDCTQLTEIVSSRNIPPVCGDQALADIDMWDCTVYVPEEYIDAYLEAPQWCDFFIEGAEYSITFMVDGEVYAEDRVKYGAEITLPTAPEKEGYTFIGWQDILAVMPAYNMTVNAEFEANDYIITYKVDGEVYHTETVTYDEAIIPIEAPEKDGYAFNRWEGLPETMPAGDIEVTAVYDEIPAEITVTIGKYGSTMFCSEYALDFSKVEGLRAYAAAGYNTESGVVTMLRVETSDMGVGLFLKGEPGCYVVPIIDYSNDNTLNMLVGTLEKTVVNNTSDDGKYTNYQYIVKSGETVPGFYQFEDGGTSDAGKAYLQIPTAWLSGAASKSVEIRFDDGETTDIDEVKGENSKVKDVYDLSGRKVTNPTKGIYIVNGKKVLLK